MENRLALEERYKWAIEEMFTEASFTERIAKVRGMIEEMATFNATLTLEDDVVLRVLKLQDAINLDVMDIICFAHMKLDENTKDGESQTRLERGFAIMVEAQTSTSFIAPALLGLEIETLKSVVASDPRYADYKHMIDDLLRLQAHVLSPDSEKLMAMLSDVTGASQSIFGMLDNADMTYESVTLPNGEVQPLTKSGYIKFLENADQNVRKAAFENFFKSYEAHKNTIAGTYGASVKKDVAYAKIRGYQSAIDMYLEAEKIPSAVYDNLVASVNANAHVMHRYVALRKRMLGVENLHIYDVYAPLVSQAKREIPYDDAYKMVSEGLKPLGEAYQDLLVKCQEERWIDVYETEGKRGGAYSWGSYRSKPYILLNYQKNLNDVFTLAHELGHSMHSHYSRLHQAPANAEYSMFVAEVASTVNEAIMMRYMLQNTTDPQEKMYLLNHFMEQFKGTVFRQTMFAEFERDVHASFEKDQPMNVDALNALYMDLNKRYFGPDMVLDDAIQYEWMRIPHFYNAFYVYKYATGFSAAMAISKRILSGEPGALEGYFEFLKAGGSVYPLEALKLAGVDMTQPETVDLALEVFAEVISEFESLC